jgi:hypothetical protein
MLAEAIAQAHERNEAALAAKVAVPRQELDDATRQLLGTFAKFCSENGVPNCPAKPNTVALFIRSLPEANVLPTCEAIQACHDYYGLASPIASASVRAELERTLKIVPPRSWPRAEQLAFSQLPVEIRAVIARREIQRETELRRCQNLAAEAKKQASVAEPATQPQKEVIQDDHQT